MTENDECPECGAAKMKPFFGRRIVRHKSLSRTVRCWGRLCAKCGFFVQSDESCIEGLEAIQNLAGEYVILSGQGYRPDDIWEALSLAWGVTPTRRKDEKE